MTVRKDLTGQKFGRLEVIGIAETRHYSHGNQYYWRCRCKCGNICTVSGEHLKSGHTKSCGCLNTETRSRTHATHKMTDSKVYAIWTNIKQRCLNPSNKSFADYGGRGITMYEPWVNSFLAFYSYVSQLEHYGEAGYSLDRIDNNSGYELGNLRWTTKKEQARNRRSNHLVEYEGEKMTLTEASEKSGLSVSTLRKRLNRGLTGFPLFLLPTRN